MVKDLQDYALDYFALCVALGVGTFLYISYMEDRVMQQIIALGIAHIKAFNSNIRVCYCCCAYWKSC